MGGTMCVCNRKEDQVARAVYSLPWFVTNKVLKSVERAEEKLGKPPTIYDVFIEVKLTYNMILVKSVYETLAVITSLMREDWIYTDKIGYRVSLTKHEGFSTFSDKIRMHFGDRYEFRRDGTMQTSAKGKTLNLENVLSILKSKDEELMKKDSWIWEGKESRFLDGKPLRNTIAFCTYPRSGNSLMRSALESLTGIATGSTGSLNTGTTLQYNGLKGQHICDERVWVTKAHHPCKQPSVLNMVSDKVICIVRNPIDVIPSMGQITNTLSHSAQLEFSMDKEYPEWWDWFVKHQTDTMARYFDVLYKHTVEQKKNPILFVRFEDMVSNKQPSLVAISKYLLDLDDITGTNIERRVTDVAGKPIETYALKDKTTSFNKNIDKYTPEQL